MTTGPFRILVTGTRHTTEVQDDYVRQVLYLATARPLAQHQEVIIVQGACPYGGVDAAAEKWAISTLGVTNEAHPPKTAHPNDLKQRNTDMVAAGAHMCLAFPSPTSRGTWDCLTKAANAGIHVRIYPLNTPEAAR